MWRRSPPPTVLQTVDRDLVRRMLAGDEAAFEELFEANFQGLYRFALARLDYDHELAKDMAQTALCTAIAKLDTYRFEAPLFAWLCAICRFELSAHYRRQQRRPHEVELPEEAGATRGTLESLILELENPEQQLLRAEVGRLVHVAIDHLPRHYRHALEWKYLEGWSVQEIADRLDLSLKATESVLTRARSAFREGFSALASAAAPSNTIAGSSP